MHETGLILLGAGAAIRMGQPKQLLDVGGRPLIRHCVETALRSECRPIVVVLGALATRIHSVLADLPVGIVLNDRWEEGMGTSIRAGLMALPRETLSGVVLALADQPLITASVFDGLRESAREPGCSIVASSYDGTMGVPAYFDRGLFPELMRLEPGSGCKRILQRHAAAVRVRSCPEAAADVDTPEDYENLLRTLSGSPVRAGNHAALS